MVAVGFCSYWHLAVAAAAGSTAAAVAVSGYFYTTLGLSSLHCHGGVLGLQIVIVSLPVIQGRAGLRLAGQSPCV